MLKITATILILLVATACVARGDQLTNNNARPPSAFKMRLDEIKAEQKIAQPRLPTQMSPFQVPPPPNSYQVNTNNLETNEPETDSIPPRDAMETWLLQKITSIKGDLQKTNLNPVVEQSLQMELWQFREQLTEHRAQVRDQTALAETLRTNPMSGLTNPPDLIGSMMSRSVENYERESANPALPPNLRKTFEMLAEERKQQLANHETNAQLWINLRLAQQSKNVEQVAHAKRELADYLAARLGKIQGKTYPLGMSLEAIMAEYQKQSGDYHWFDNVTVIRAIILTVFLLPPLIMLFMAIKKRISK
jgi:hypothetical protein